MNSKTRSLTYGAVIAALYVALTLISNALGMASGVIQIRLSEALTILPMLTPAAVPGLFVGCVLANVLTGCALWDVIFGSLATLIGALGTWKLAKNKWMAPLFPILSNAIIVPFVLQYVYAFSGSYQYFFITVGIGEVISCGVLGILLYNTLKKTSLFK